MSTEISQGLGSFFLNTEGWDKAEADITAKVTGAILTKCSEIVRGWDKQAVTDAETGLDVNYNTKQTVDDVTVEFVLGKGSVITPIEEAFKAGKHCTALIKNGRFTYVLNVQLNKITSLGVDPAGTHTYNLVLSVSGEAKVTFSGA